MIMASTSAAKNRIFNRRIISLPVDVYSVHNMFVQIGGQRGTAWFTAHRFYYKKGRRNRRSLSTVLHNPPFYSVKFAWRLRVDVDTAQRSAMPVPETRRHLFQCGCRRGANSTLCIENCTITVSLKGYGGNWTALAALFLTYALAVDMSAT